MSAADKAQLIDRLLIDNKNFQSKTLIGVTNAECMNDVFPGWTRRAYLSSSGKKSYRPYNLNMPITVLRRSGEAHKVDSPLTEFGKVCCSIYGYNLVQKKLIPNQIFCSPELRSVETAIIIARKICDEVLDGESGRLIPIYVDASLCEWRNFDEQNTEKYWLTTEQFVQIGYCVNTEYTPLRQSTELASNETPQQYYERLIELLGSVVQNYDGCSMLVGSSGLISLIRNHVWKSGKDLQRISAKIPKCISTVICLPKCTHSKESHELRPFTRTLTEAIDKRKSSLANSD